jgi:hypothetical protein
MTSLSLLPCGRVLLRLRRRDGCEVELACVRDKGHAGAHDYMPTVRLRETVTVSVSGGRL